MIFAHDLRRAPVHAQRFFCTVSKHLPIDDGPNVAIAKEELNDNRKIALHYKNCCCARYLQQYFIHAFILAEPVRFNSFSFGVHFVFFSFVCYSFPLNNREEDERKKGQHTESMVMTTTTTKTTEK